MNAARTYPSLVAVATIGATVAEPGELATDGRTRLMLLLLLQDPDRWWTASGMTTALGWCRDTVRRVHIGLVDTHWAVRLVEEKPANVIRHWVRLTSAGVDCARAVLRDGLTTADSIDAAALHLSTDVLDVLDRSGTAPRDPSTR
jgi:hypothetical protein